MAEKLFYSMGEVAEMFDVNASLIRHWESQFERACRPRTQQERKPPLLAARMSRISN